jgi:type IV pilus assembly protein PilN
MIRVNLMPRRANAHRPAAVATLVGLAVALVATAAGAATVDSWMSRRLEEQLADNRVVEGRIARIRLRLRDHAEVRARMEELERRRQVVEELEAGRHGPALALAELARLVSVGGQPSIDHARYLELCRARPGRCFDPDWDGRRLWVRGFREEDRQVEIQGLALSHEDVAELLRRLALSDYFHEVTLVSTRAEPSAPATGEGAVAFEIRCRVAYGGAEDPAVADQEA